MPIFLGKNKVSCKYLIPTAGTVDSEKKAVNFYDYDGTLLHSYTREEALRLSELPSLPDRSDDDLTCQGWNYVLNGYVNDDGTAVSGIIDNLTATDENITIDIGAMYIPTGGATHINITMADKYRSTHSVRFAQTVANGVTIDWGDGTTPQTYSHTDATTVDHEYAIAAAYPVSYTIKMTVADGCIMTLGGNIDSDTWCNITGEQYYSSDETHYGVKSARIKSIYLGKNINTIVENTFQCCDGLQYITIPNNVTVIEGYSFWGSHSLRHITIPNSVTSIDNYAFYGCHSLASVTIPNGVTSIGNQAFYGCYSLASVTIPNSVTSIGGNAFFGCYSLASVTILNGVTSIGNSAFYQCFSLASVAIPNSVTSIGNSAFYSCYALASVTIPNSVTSIGGNAFRNCYSLASVTIPDSVSSIGNEAFGNCSSLASISIPNGVTSIGQLTFSQCYGITKYDFSTHTTVPTLSNTNAFTSTATDKQIVVPDALYDEWIAATNWSSTSVKPYIIKVSDYVEPQYVPPHTIITYTDGNITEVEVGDDGILTWELAKGGSSATDRNTTIQSVEIGGDVVSIGDSAFYWCTSLTSVMIPEGVTSIGASAFYNCSGLTSVTIPSSVTSIWDSVFASCLSLTSVTFKEDSQLTSIGDYVFSGCRNLTSITIPSSVTSIGEQAFSGCSGLTSVTISEGVTSIGNFVFANCSGLTSVTIPSSVTSIGFAVFLSCSSLNDITFDKTMEEVSNMTNYSWGISSGKVIKCTDGNLTVS